MDAAYTRLPVIVGGNVHLIVGKQIIREELEHKLSEPINVALFDIE